MPRLVPSIAIGVFLFGNVAPDGGLSGQWTVAEQPSLVIGAVTGDPNDELNMVMGAARLSNGGMVILNDWQLRFYDASGSHLRTVGGRGDGPGEFQGPSLYRRAGDTLVVFDKPRFRITTFDPQGDLVSVTSLDPPEPLPGYVIEGSRMHLLPDGTILYSMMQPGPPPASAGLFTSKRQFARYDPQNGTQTLLGSPFEHTGEYFRYGSQTIGMERPFASVPWEAAGSERVYITPGDQFLIDVYAFDGTRLERFSLPNRQPERVTSEDEAWFYRTYIQPDKERNPARASAIDRAWNAVGKGGHHMAIRDTFVDDLGNLWLEVGVWGRDEHQKLWLILDRQGREVATIRLPDSIGWIIEVGEDYVLAGRRGDFDIPHVVIHELVRSPEQ